MRSPRIEWKEEAKDWDLDFTKVLSLGRPITAFSSQPPSLPLSPLALSPPSLPPFNSVPALINTQECELVSVTKHTVILLLIEL